MNMENEINELILSNREGSYWDFKECPHDNNASLLHDILSLANCKHSGNRYLIIGVSDPKDGCKIIGLRKQQENRKTQSEIVDFLRNKKFAGDIRPEVEVSTIILDEEEIDVIKILDKPDKPYYLTDDYALSGKTVRANYIYTRVLDTNTPINKSADLYHVEKMWAERFGLDMSPVERMKFLLTKPNEWYKNLGNKNYAYHKQFSEFRIEFSKLKSITENFSFLYANPNTHIGDATFKFHSTTLFELKYLTLDGMLVYLGEPSPHCVDDSKYDISYFYFNLNSLDGLFHSFLNDGKIDTSSRGHKCPFLFFENEDSQDQFDKYLINNQEMLNEIDGDAIATEANKRMNRNGLNYHPDPILINKIKQIYEKWNLL
jgi:hypothetical protein